MGQSSSKRKQGGDPEEAPVGFFEPVANPDQLPWSYSCDLCLVRIPGTRYSCSTCRHFDICKKCKDEFGHEHLLYEEALHPQQIFDQLYAAPTTGQTLLRMFKLYAHRRAFAYRKEEETFDDLRVSVDLQIAQETSESQIQVNLSREIPIRSSTGVTSANGANGATEDPLRYVSPFYSSKTALLCSNSDLRFNF